MPNDTQPVLKVKISTSEGRQVPHAVFSTNAPKITEVGGEDYGAYDSSRSNPSAPKLKIKIVTGRISKAVASSLGNSQTVQPPDYVSSSAMLPRKSLPTALEKSLADIKRRRKANESGATEGGSKRKRDSAAEDKVMCFFIQSLLVLV